MDDPTLKAYWQHRQTKPINQLTPSRQRIVRQQAGQCPVCGESLFNGELLDLHHRLPKANGGQDVYSNLEVLHLYCHHQRHAQLP